MKYNLKAPPSKTEQNLSFDIPDLPQSLTPVITGTTPIDDGPPPPNQSPAVSAGSDKTITLPVNSVDLKGTANDPDGTISAYVWEKLNGSGNIESPNGINTKVSGLTQGGSVFRLTAIDNNGASSFDDVAVIVNAATPPPDPPPAGYALTFQTGYNQMSDITTNNGQYGQGTISTAQKTEGTGSFYSRPANVSNGTRSEVQYTGSPQNPIEGAIEWDVYYEVIIPNNGCSIQWHPNTPGSSGSPFLAHEGGRFAWNNWKMTSQGGVNTKYPTGFTIPKNKWLKMRCEFKFGSNGYWRHFIDGVKVAEWTGQVGDGSGQYLKVGYNGWDSNSAASRIYYDNLKIYKKS